MNNIPQQHADFKNAINSSEHDIAWMVVKQHISKYTVQMLQLSTVQPPTECFWTCASHGYIAISATTLKSRFDFQHGVSY